MSQLVQIDYIEKLKSHSNFIVCSFYTKSYEEHAMRLKDSLDKFGINYYFSLVEDAGYWEANTRLKPHFILECLKKFPTKDILYLDSDAIVKKPIDYFNHIKADVGIFITKGMSGMSHDYLAGTLFFKNTELTKALVQQWINEQINGQDTQVDQDSLDLAMHKFADSIEIENLPLGYIKIFDKDYDGEVYIEQYQASRSLTKLRRKKIRRRNRVLASITVGIVAVIIFKIFIL